MKNDNILISIIMPAWNAANTISDSVRSVLTQTYNTWELIVIDDASTDSTCEIVQYFARTDSRISLLRNLRNAGVSSARNKGILAAHGPWIAFLDSDDLWMPQKLEKQVKAITRPDGLADTVLPDLVFTGSRFIDQAGQDLSCCLHAPKTITYRQLLKQNVISCSSVLVRRELLLQYPMKHDKMHEDYAVWLQILQSGHVARGINEPLLVYRLSPRSKSGNKKKAAAMTYRVYRFIGLGHVSACYYFIWYAFKSLKKYFIINRSK